MQKRLRGAVRLLACAGTMSCLLLGTPAAWGQSAASRGSLGGTVTDPQGNAIAGAQVTVRNVDFSSTRSLVTDEKGAYSATMLTTGVYTVEVKAQGFTLKKPARITLNVGASVEVDVRMGVAAVSQGVTVTAHGPMVEGNTLPPASKR